MKLTSLTATPSKPTIRVKFDDGTLIERNVIKGIKYEYEIFRDAIIHIGINKIMLKYNPVIDGEALILNKKHLNYPESSKELDDVFFLNTHGGAEHYKRVLEEIADKLNIGIKIDITKY